MIFESHAHYDDGAFDEDREALLGSFAKNGIDTVINIGASLESCRKRTCHIHWQKFLVLNCAIITGSNTGMISSQWCPAPFLESIPRLTWNGQM